MAVVTVSLCLGRWLQGLHLKMIRDRSLHRYTARVNSIAIKDMYCTVGKCMRDTYHASRRPALLLCQACVKVERDG